MHDLCDMIDKIGGGGKTQEFIGNLLVVIGILGIMIFLFWDCCQDPLKIGFATALISAVVIGGNYITADCAKDKPKPEITPAIDDFSNRVANMDTKMPEKEPQQQQPQQPPQPQLPPQLPPQQPQQPQPQPQIKIADPIPPPISSESATVVGTPSIPQPPIAVGAGIDADDTEIGVNFNINDFAPKVEGSAPKPKQFNSTQMSKLKNFLNGAQVAESDSGSSFDREDLDNNFGSRRFGGTAAAEATASSRTPPGFFAEW